MDSTATPVHFNFRGVTFCPCSGTPVPVENKPPPLNMNSERTHTAASFPSYFPLLSKGGKTHEVMKSMLSKLELALIDGTLVYEGMPQELSDKIIQIIAELKKSNNEHHYERQDSELPLSSKSLMSNTESQRKNDSIVSQDKEANKNAKSRRSITNDPSSSSLSFLEMNNLSLEDHNSDNDDIPGLGLLKDEETNKIPGLGPKDEEMSGLDLETNKIPGLELETDKIPGLDLEDERRILVRFANDENNSSGFEDGELIEISSDDDKDDKNINSSNNPNNSIPVAFESEKKKGKRPLYVIDYGKPSQKETTSSSHINSNSNNRNGQSQLVRDFSHLSFDEEYEDMMERRKCKKVRFEDDQVNRDEILSKANWESLLLWQPKHVVKAKMDYKSNHPLDLNFEVGDIIEVLGIENDDWWNGTIADTDTFGSFPCSFVEIIPNDDNYYEEQEEIELVPKLPPRIKLHQRRSSTRSTSSTKSTHSTIHQDYSDGDIVINGALARELQSLRKTKNSASIEKNEDDNNVEETVYPPTRNNGKNMNSNNSRIKKKVVEKFDPVSRCTVVYDKNFEAPLDLSEVDFEVVDDHARNAPKDVEKSIDRLSKYLTAEWTHPIYKLRCIFAWVTHNIAYDCDAFYRGGTRYNSAKDVLKHRRAVCAGYSELFHELASAAHLDTWKVNGEAKGAGYQPGDDVKGTGGHAWNVCRLDGEYFLIDCTWGAGIVSNQQFERQFNPFYFMASPLHLIYTHFPENSREQYLNPPIRYDEFVGLPYFKPEWFNSGFSMAKYHGCVIDVESDLVEFEIEQLSADNERRPGGSLEWKGQNIEAFINYLGIVDGGKKLYRLQCSIPSSGNGTLTIFSFTKEIGKFATSYKIINHGSGSYYQPFVKIYPPPFQFSLVSPIQSTLPSNQRVQFEVILFNQERLRDLPTISVHSSDFKKKRTLEACGQINKKDKSVRLCVEVMLSLTGQWVLSYSMNGENLFHFIATYECR
ncbi:7653_t:CDS:2 [Ambispora leptoticha]|uniref:7653_t:CDS:1 n=1 Tax=Ambispora leptoticha TaxID=144679 RepID=A0A9N9AIR4_9GLOM|nr:7653_t:CDS:2 [Ambispora leptoticha]